MGSTPMLVYKIDFRRCPEKNLGEVELEHETDWYQIDQKATEFFRELQATGLVYKNFQAF